MRAYLVNGMYTETEAAGQKALELTGEKAGGQSFWAIWKSAEKRLSKLRQRQLLKQDR